MINNVATKYGGSFAGTAAYILHDKRTEKQIAEGKSLDTSGQTRRRVAWTQTRNLGTNDPDMAWRIMAYTYMDRERLKAVNGVKSTGRKAKPPVMHVSFSWHPEEWDITNEHEMKRFATAALKRLGMQDAQCLIVCHKDEPQPHIHLLINRTDPKTGKMLNCYHDQSKLSKLAGTYEKQRGKVLCKQRELNERERERQARKRKDARLAVRDDNPSRADYQTLKQAANDNDRRRALFEQRKNDAAKLFRKGDDLKARHADRWRELEAAHRDRRTEIKNSRREEIRDAVKLIAKEYRDEKAALQYVHRREEEAFKKDENRAIGRVMNTFRALDFRRLLRLADDKRRGIGQEGPLKAVFKIMGDAGARLEALKARHAAEALSLDRRQDAREGAAIKAADAKAAEELKKADSLFIANRQSLRTTQRLDLSKHRAEWKKHTDHYRAEFAKVLAPGDAPLPGRDADLSAWARQALEGMKRMDTDAGRGDTARRVREWETKDEDGRQQKPEPSKDREEDRDR